MKDKFLVIFGLTLNTLDVLGIVLKEKNISYLSVPLYKDEKNDPRISLFLKINNVVLIKNKMIINLLYSENKYKINLALNLI